MNGNEVRNMRDLARFIEGTEGEFVKLQLQVNATKNLQIVIDRKKAEAIHNKILIDHNIVYDRSPDLL